MPGAIAAQGEPTPADPSNRWGINNDHQATGPLPDDERRLPDGDVLLRAREAGLGWVRYVLFWHAVNPAPGDYRWFVPDVEIARLRAAGFNILLQVSFPPTWTTGATYPNELAAFYCLDETKGGDGVRPGDPGTDDYFNCRDPERRPGYRPPGQPQLADRSQDFREFVTAVVARYGPTVQAFGFGMEVHNKVFWKGTPRQLMDEVLRPGYDIVKAFDPSLLVVGPDEDVEAFLDGMLRMEAEDIASGKRRVFDVLAFHAFAHSGWTTPEQLEVGWRPGGWGECTFPTSGPCSMKAIVDRYAKGRPVWLTEFGYRAGAADDARAADWLTTWIQGIKARPWIDKAFLYRLQQDPDGRGFGLFGETASVPASPALRAVQQALASQPLPQSSYLAEGATGPFFDLDVAIANPNAAPAPVAIRFLKPGGEVVSHTLTLAAKSQQTIRVDQVGGLEDTAVSTVVTSTTGLPLLVERTMFWNDTYYGGHGGTAVDAPRRTWYFGEGAQGFFDTFVLLANANPQPAQVTVRFLLEGEPPVEVQRTVEANARANVWAIELPELDGRAFSIVVDADIPIIAERALYFPSARAASATARFWEGGHESAGVASPATSWFHAEGATGDFFDEYILVGNPGDDAADVTFTFLLDTGDTIVATRTVPPQSRYTLNVEAAADFADLGLLTIVSGDPEQLRHAAVSTTVTANVPVVSERAMYWSGGFQTWYEAHNSFGVTGTAARWGLAEGRVGGPLSFETWILVANPNPTQARIRVTLLRQGGASPIPREFTVAPTSRFNVYVNDAEWAAAGLKPGEAFGAIVESLDPEAPIAVERAMYWTAGGLFWSGGTNATATRLP